MAEETPAVFAPNQAPRPDDTYRGRPPGPYQPGSSWRIWVKQLNYFLTLRDVVKEEHKRIIFLTPAYYPNSNGEAERFVQTFQQGLYKGLRSEKTIEQAANDLLFQYRVTPHPATGLSPSEMLMGRQLRTALNVIRETKKSEG